MGKPPYGYMEDPVRRGYWLVDPEAGTVVKHIFDLAVAGLGPSRIARRLKKRIPNAMDDIHIAEDTQEAIMPMAQWQRVQELRQNKRGLTKADHQGLFSGLLYCADCGSRLTFVTCTTQKKFYDHYVRSHYRRQGGCTTHYIREDMLSQIVLERIRAVNGFVRTDMQGFEEAWLHCSQKEQERAIHENEKRMAQIRKRLDDIDTLQSRIYEDSVLGNLSRERWQKMRRTMKPSRSA